MLQVTIDIVPQGKEKERYTIKTLYIVNVGGNHVLGNYAIYDGKDPRYAKCVNAVDAKGNEFYGPISCNFSIGKFDRSKGALALIKKVLTRLIKNG